MLQSRKPHYADLLSKLLYNTKGLEYSVTIPNGFKNIYNILIVRNVFECVRLAVAVAAQFDRASE